MKREVEGIELDLEGLQILPGLINAHDHLEFALFPRLGHGTYANATEWAHDVYHPDQSPIRQHLQVPKPLRLLWGGLRNLVCGVTTVCHHNPYETIFDDGFPVRVVRQFGWAHSLAFESDVRKCFHATPPGAPFLIHAGEGTDDSAAAEVLKLLDLGVLDERAVLIHAVGFRKPGWNAIRIARASIIWCPRSNLFTLGRTLSQEVVTSGIPVALGTDSALTAEGDMLDEIRTARETIGWFPPNLFTDAATRILRLPPQPEDWIATPAFGDAPELVVIGGAIRLIGPRLARTLPPRICRELFPLHIETRPPILVRWNVARMLDEARDHLGEDVRLAGRRVWA